MKVKQIKFIIVLGLFVVSGILSWSTYLRDYAQQDTVSIHSFPTEIGGWVAEELPITEDEYAILETRNVFVRKYTGPKGQEVYLFTVYSQFNRKVSHPPEVCYTGSGIEVASNVLKTVNVAVPKVSFDVHRLELDQKVLRQVAYYWFKVGKEFTPSYWKQQMMIAFKNLLGKPEGSALIRVSTSVKGSDAQADADIKEFIDLAMPHIYKHLP